MVAEKAADLILGNTPLPAADVPYYRYRDDMPLTPQTSPKPIPSIPTQPDARATTESEASS
jgi:hypothetical protein